MLELLEEKDYALHVDGVDNEHGNENIQYPTKFPNSFSLSYLPHHRLTHKEGTIVILVQNVNLKIMLISITTLIVRRLYDDPRDI